MIHFETLRETRYDPLGYIPHFLVDDGDNTRPAKDQFNRYYIGGWCKMKGFTLNLKTMSLKYPGDPPMLPLAVAELGHEKVYVYPHAWVLILQPDGQFEVARLD